MWGVHGFLTDMRGHMLLAIIETPSIVFKQWLPVVLEEKFTYTNILGLIIPRISKGVAVVLASTFVVAIHVPAVILGVQDSILG